MPVPWEKTCNNNSKPGREHRHSRSWPVHMRVGAFTHWDYSIFGFTLVGHRSSGDLATAKLLLRARCRCCIFCRPRCTRRVTASIGNRGSR